MVIRPGAIRPPVAPASLALSVRHSTLGTASAGRSWVGTFTVKTRGSLEKVPLIDMINRLVRTLLLKCTTIFHLGATFPVFSGSGLPSEFSSTFPLSPALSASPVYSTMSDILLLEESSRR